MKDINIKNILNKKLFTITVRTQIFLIMFGVMTLIQLLSYENNLLYQQMYELVTFTNIITFLVAWKLAPIFEAQINVRSVSEEN